MSNSASFVVFKHAHTAVTHAQQAARVLGINTSTAVSVTSHTVPQALFITKTTMSVPVMVASYSYDGVVHTDSYWSDI